VFPFLFILVSFSLIHLFTGFGHDDDDERVLGYSQ